MSIKTSVVALVGALVLSTPSVFAKDVKEPAAPGSGVAGVNAKANLAGDLYADGKRRLDNKDWEGALKRFNTVVQLDPKSLGGFYYRGVVLKQLGKAEAAKKDFKAAAALTASTAEDYDLRGKANTECGQQTAAAADFAKAKALLKKAG